MDEAELRVFIGRLVETKLEAKLGDLSGVIDALVTESAVEERRLTEESIEKSMDAYYLLYTGALVFLMQAGFAMLCAGSLRERNVKNIMLKNLLDTCVGAIGFWMFGYAFAYGNKSNTSDITFVGDEYWFLGGDFENEDTYHKFYFHFFFAATSATIVSGAVAERCQMTAYVLYSFFITAWVYPVVVHQVWSANGYFSAGRADGNLFNGVGVIDFAGCGVVHMVGGLSALVGAAVLGPRTGRFDPITGQFMDKMPGHNAALVVLGTFLLWFGWYGFNPGSTFGIHGMENMAARTAVTTTLAAASGTIGNLGLHYLMEKILSLEEACNGALAGLVSITSGCSVVDPWAATIIGVCGALFYTLGQKIIIKLGIDDPLNASPVHFFAGAWGLIVPSLFARGDHMIEAYGIPNQSGLFMGGGANMLATQLIGCLAISGWVLVHMVPFFFLLRMLNIFRVDTYVEEMGMDAWEHGGGAYNIGDRGVDATETYGNGPSWEEQNKSGGGPSLANKDATEE